MIAFAGIFLLTFAGTAFAQEAVEGGSVDFVDTSAVENIETMENTEAVETAPVEEELTLTPYDVTAQSIKKKGLFFNKDTVFENASALTLEERQQLYDSFKKNPTLVGLLNGLVGFGLGSWVQKEFLPAAGFMTLELAGWGIVIMGVSVIQSIADSAAETDSAAGAIGAAFAGPIVGIMVIGLGGIVVIASRLASAGICVGITNGYNAKLRNALGLNEKQEVALLPLIDPYEKKAGLMVSLKL